MAGGSELPASQKNIQEEIGEFLQDMKRRMEIIYGRERRQNVSDHHRNSPSLYDFGAGKTFHHPCKIPISDSRDKPLQSPTWCFPNPSNTLLEEEEKEKERGKSESSEKSRLTSHHHSETTNALGSFMDVMKKTIESWSDHYQLLVVESKRASRMENVHAIDKLDFVQDPSKNFPNMEGTLDLQNNKPLESSIPSISNQNNTMTDGISQEFGHNVTQINHPQLDLETAFAMTPRQSGQSKPICGDDGDTSSRDREDVPILQTMVKVTTTPSSKRKKSRKEVVTPVIRQDLTIRRFQYNVEVVESPPWLPEGWITELKTRSAGGSAGCKDKYYYDTVTKRRCRSQKEVFSLIETGKLGRYKRRTKLEPLRKISGAETITDANDISEDLVGNNEETTDKPEISIMSCNTSLPARRTTPGKSLAAPLAMSSPPGQHGIVTNNMFLPYRPGQPSEWMMCESLTNVPRPTMLDHFRLSESMSNSERASIMSNSERGSIISNGERGPIISNGERGPIISNGERGPIISNSERVPIISNGERGSFISNSERGSIMSNSERGLVAAWPRPRYSDNSDGSSARPFIERFEMGRGTQSEHNNTLLVGGHISSGRDAYSSMEAVPKRSRKSSKRSATAF